MSKNESTSNDPNRYDAPERGSVPALDRRSLLKGIAVAGAAATMPLLAACGSSNGSGSTSPTNTSKSRTPGNTPSSSDSGGSADVLTKVSDVPVGGGVILTGPKVVVTQPTKGTFEGFSAVCTHLQCIVGTVSGGKILCPCHGSMYSIKDGSVVGGPAPKPLPKISVKVEGANIVSA